MPTKKYDFAKLKQEFFESDIDDIKPFFERNYNVYNQHIQENTSGWPKEKQKIKMEAQKKAQELYEQERQEKWIKVLKNVDTARIAGLQHLRTQIVNSDKINKLRVREIIEVLKHMRLELGESTENPKELPTDTQDNKLDELIKLRQNAIQ